MRETYHLEDPSIDGRTMLIWIFKVDGDMDLKDLTQDRNR
jgi:hypothetical protein